MQEVTGKLSGKKSKALAAMLSSKTLEEAAAKADVNPATIWRWLQQDDFRSAYDAARRQVVEVALANLQGACGKAVSTLEAVLDDSEAPFSCKVAAARVILETSVKIIELQDHESRIAALEAKQRGGE